MENKLKVGIIGSGAVGSTTAYALVLKNLISELIFIDTFEGFAKAQAADLRDGVGVLNEYTSITYGFYDDLKDFDVVVITASVPAKKVQNRLDLYEANKKLMTEITNSIVASGFKGIYIIASNPVDLMTKVCAQIVRDNKRVIGSGTILDNARLKEQVAKEVNVGINEVESSVIGEHGNSSVPLFSTIKINGISLNKYVEDNNLNFDYEKVKKNMVNTGYDIFNVKGSTTFGIATALTKIISAIVQDTKEVLSVTTYIEEYKKIKDVYISFFATIGKDGIENIEEFKGNAQEYKDFLYSVDVLKSYN